MIKTRINKYYTVITFTFKEPSFLHAMSFNYNNSRIIHEPDIIRNDILNTLVLLPEISTTVYNELKDHEIDSVLRKVKAKLYFKRGFITKAELNKELKA